MTIACFLLFTFQFLTDFKVPSLKSGITSSILSLALFEYMAYSFCIKNKLNHLAKMSIIWLNDLI